MSRELPNPETIFAQAIEIESAENRSAFLDRACLNDPELRRDVEKLVLDHFKAGSFLETPAADIMATIDPPTAERPGTVIGPYKLLQQIGEGGMGAVFMAEQTRPVQRKVALKIIKPGLDSRQVIARFEAERQALALMDHPNIAKVLDAGTTETGRPYFVMELVKGVPITRYCDERHLMPRERMELFVPVCQAVQHAHQKGIIHRDLKPSNVMVCLYDGKPVPKVIDFGVAKATGQQLTEKTMFTEFGQVVGTLEYMSPEQAELNQLDIDTRSDIYSLGVLLYELLTGTTPLERKRFNAAAMMEVLRLIREEDPPKPSTRLSTTAELPSIAANRGLEPKKLSGLLRGELDWIVMKCLEKDRNRRYETANGLAMDLGRYLHDEAVQACPPSAGYRLRKLLRRNKGPATAAAAVFLVLLAGVAVSTWQAVRATRAEADARLAEQQAADDRDTAVRAEAEAKEQRDQAVASEKKAVAEKQRADVEAGISKAVNDFLQVDLLEQAASEAQVDYGFIPNLSLTVKEALNRAAARIGDRFKKQPRVEAEIQLTIGASLLGVGEPGRALPHLERAVALRKLELGSDHADTLTANGFLAKAYAGAGREAEALTLNEKTLERRRATLGLDHVDTLVTMNNVGWGYLSAGRFNDAITLLEQAVQMGRAKLGADHKITLYCMSSLGNAYGEAGRPPEALTLLKEALRRRRATLGPDHPSTLVSMNNVANMLRTTGLLAEAVPLAEESLKLHQASLGPDHPLTLVSMNNLGVTYLQAGRTRDALPVFEKCLKLVMAKHGPDHPDSLMSLDNLGDAYVVADRLADAIPLLERALNGRRVKLGPDHPKTNTSINNLANAYLSAARLPEALALYEEGLRLSKAIQGAEHPETLTSMNNLAHAYYLQRRYDEAETLYKQTLEVSRTKLGPDHQATLTCQNNLGTLYQSRGRYDEAESLFKQNLQIQRSKLGADHPRTLNSMHNLALLYRAQLKYSDAEPLLQDALQRRTATLGADHTHTMHTRYGLAELYHTQGKFDQAEPLIRQSVELTRQKLGMAHPHTQQSIRNLISCYGRMDVPSKAEPLHRELADFQKQKVGADSPQYAGELALLGLNLLRQNKWTDAEAILREGQAIRDKKEPDTWSTFHIKSLLGGAKLGQKKYADAEPLLLAGYEGMKQREAKIPPQGKVRLIEALHRLVELYEATGQNDKAAEWRTKLAAEKKDSDLKKQESTNKSK